MEAVRPQLGVGLTDGVDEVILDHSGGGEGGRRGERKWRGKGWRGREGRSQGITRHGWTRREQDRGGGGAASDWFGECDEAGLPL